MIYHYSDARAFASIVGNARLWATDFSYLNEFTAKLQHLSKELRESVPTGLRSHLRNATHC